MVDLSFYKGKKVLVTGHTGFKGTWLCKILINAGAKVVGYSLESPTIPNVFSLSMYEKLSKKGDKVDTLKLEVVHSYVDVPDNLSTLPMDSESNGTVGMFALVGPIIDSLINGRTIVIDEFGTYLHPEIIKWLVSLFSNEQNPKNGQLIACTQELALLNLDLLRRDQIYFTNKNYKSGSCELYSLSDFTGIRNDSNIIKLYLDGRFDAVPIIHRGGVI